MTHEFLEGGSVPALRLADQHRVVYAAFLPSHAAPCGVLVLSDVVTADSVYSLTLSSRVGPFANRKCYRPCIGRHFIIVSFTRPVSMPYPGLHRNRRRIRGSVSRNYRPCGDFWGRLGDSGAGI